MRRKTDYNDQKQYRQHDDKNNKKKWGEKQLYGYFKEQTSEISHEGALIWLRKRKLKRETESLQISAQNNAIRTMSKQK